MKYVPISYIMDFRINFEGSIQMIYKVLYQQSRKEMPVRENTETLYLEAIDVRDVRKKLADKPYNVEFIQPLSGKFLDYEKQSAKFKLEKL